MLRYSLLGHLHYLSLTRSIFQHSNCSTRQTIRRRSVENTKNYLDSINFHYAIFPIFQSRLLKRWHWFLFVFFFLLQSVSPTVLLNSMQCQLDDTESAVVCTLASFCFQSLAICGYSLSSTFDFAEKGQGSEPINWAPSSATPKNKPGRRPDRRNAFLKACLGRSWEFHDVSGSRDLSKQD